MQDTYNYKIDIWSVGCIFAELATLAVPFKGIPKAEDPRSMFCEEQIEAIVKVKGTPTKDVLGPVQVSPILEPGQARLLPGRIPKRTTRGDVSRLDVCDRG